MFVGYNSEKKSMKIILDERICDGLAKVLDDEEHRQTHSYT